MTTTFNFLFSFKSFRLQMAHHLVLFLVGFLCTFSYSKQIPAVCSTNTATSILPDDQTNTCLCKVSSATARIGTQG